MTTKLDGSLGVIFPDNSAQASAAYTAWRNRLLNGDFRLSQYNGVNAVTPTTSGYVIDRWVLNISPGQLKLTGQQVTDAPIGQKYSYKITVASSYTPVATDTFNLQQRVEGVNVVDFAFGSSGALQITLSGQVKGSVPGTYAVSVANSANDRSCVGTYTVTSTWAPLVVTFPGCTDGAWLTDTSVGLVLKFDLGCGSNFETTTIGAWNNANYQRTPSCVKFVNQPNGSTLQFAGLQLEPGSATPFERVDYGEMLRRCQRYYEVVTNRIVTVLDSTALNRFSIPAPFLVTKRADPVTTITSFTSYNGSALTVTASPSFKADGGFIAQGTTSTNLSQSLAYIASATHTSEL